MFLLLKPAVTRPRVSQAGLRLLQANPVGFSTASLKAVSRPKCHPTRLIKVKRARQHRMLHQLIGAVLALKRETQMLSHA